VAAQADADEPVDEIFLLRVAAHVLKRQHRDGRAFGRCRNFRRLGRGLVELNAIDPHRLLDVLEALVAGIGKGGVDLAAHLPECVIGDADAASFGNGFQPRGNVDAVAEDVALVDDDVADVNPDAQFDAPVGGFVRIALRHSALLLDGAAGGVHGAAEFDQDAVAGAFDDTAAMLGDHRLQQVATMGVEPGQRAFLVGPHQPAVAGDIPGENGRKPPLYTMFGHARRFAPHAGTGRSLWVAGRGV
jgi:hypothetical protein